MFNGIRLMIIELRNTYKAETTYMKINHQVAAQVSYRDEVREHL